MVAIALSMAAAGCGSTTTSHLAPPRSSVHVSSNTATASASFAQRANDDCRRFDAEIVSLPRDTTAAAYVYDTPQLISGDLKLAAEFTTLTPPSQQEAQFVELRGLKKQLIELLVGQFQTSSRGNQAALAAVNRRYEDAAIRYNQLATTLGLPACASQVAPSSRRSPSALPSRKRLASGPAAHA